MKRANGTGSVVKLPGNRRAPWAVKVPVRDRRGRVRQRYLSYHAKSADAQAALEEYNRAHTVMENDPGSYTLQQVYDLWSARKYEKAGSSSIYAYRASWLRLSCLADKKMRRITVDDLQRIIDSDKKDGLSKSSIYNDKLLMKSLYKFALERDIVAKDYSSFVEMPSVGPKYEKGILTDLQLAKVEKMAADGVPFADTVLMLCYTGFRISEFLSLTPFQYDEKNNCLRGGMKTTAGKDRIVPVHPKIAPYLAKRLSDGAPTIIANHGKPFSHNTYCRYFKKIMEEIGVPAATPHWCRHTFASLLHRAGADELAIKRMMGHADKDVTEHYTHTDIDFLRKELLKIA